MFNKLIRGVRDLAAWALRPSDVEAIRQSVRIVILGIVFAAVSVVLIAIALFLNLALEYALNVTNAPEFVKDLLDPMDWGVLVVIGLAVTLNSLRGVFNLLRIGRNDSGDDEG